MNLCFIQDPGVFSPILLRGHAAKTKKQNRSRLMANVHQITPLHYLWDHHDCE